MQWVKTPFPAGVVGVPSGELGRYPEFDACFERLLVPENTLGFRQRGYDAAHNANWILNAAMEERAAWVWLLNDDNVFDPDLLLRLLARNVDVIAPLVAIRTGPFEPMVFRQKGDLVGRTTWKDTKESGLDTSLRMGNNGLLIKRHVLEKIEPPWFRPGQEDPARMMEDIYFTRQVVEAGFTIHVDCDHLMGHITQGVVWPIPGKGVELRYERTDMVTRVKIIEPC